MISSGDSARFYYSCVIALFLIATASAQEVDRNVVHWAYSSYFGTGWYSIGNDQDAYVFRMTPRWERREASIDEDGNRHIGIEYRLPVTVGLETFVFDSLPDAVSPENVASLSVTPGIDINIPVTERWYLKSFAAAGWGTLLDGTESAWTYWGGIRSRYELGTGGLTWALINSISFVGFSPADSPSQRFWPVSAGLEFDYPLTGRWIGDQRAILHWYLNYSGFPDDLDIVGANGETLSINDQWELGLAASKQNGRIRFWKLHFDRLGLGYRFSSSGELKGINLVMHSLFDL